MSGLPFTLEPMHAEDRDAVERLHARAFGPGRFSRTAFRIREQAGDAESLAFVARVGSLLVAAVQLTPIRIGPHPAFMLGPLTVDPPFEGRGIGGALIERCAHAARAVKRDIILLVGDEPYYKRFGYVRVPMGQIRLPGPVDPMRVLALALEPGALAKAAGEVRGSA
jgi:predicted N-acetyltransferase YhbS